MMASITPRTYLIILKCSFACSWRSFSSTTGLFFFAVTLSCIYTVKKNYLFYWVAVFLGLVHFLFYFWFLWYLKSLYSLFKQDLSHRLLPWFLFCAFPFYYLKKISFITSRQVWHGPKVHTKGQEKVERTSFKTKPIKKCEK